MSQCTVEVVGPRVYLANLPFAAKDRAKHELGAKWDADRRQWWVGRAKRSQAEALAASLAAGVVMAPTAGSAAVAGSVGLTADTPAGIVADALEESGRKADADRVRAGGAAEDLGDLRVLAQVEYKGRRYYAVGETRDPATRLPLRCRLTTLDGLAPFWAECAACTLVRAYEPREYRGRTEYTTVGSLRRFRDRQADPATRRAACTECGHYGPSGEACTECGGEGSHQ